VHTVTGTLDVTVLLPCRDEARTVAACVTQASNWITSRALHGEILVVDNASTDGSGSIAHNAGARVVSEDRHGYGHALRTGIEAARGSVIVMADADGTYDLHDLSAFYDPLDGRLGVVVGNRFADGPPNAMPQVNRIGNHTLSALTRAVTGLPVTDVHCGLRSFDAIAMRDIPDWSHGMDFATHMLVYAHHTGRPLYNTPVKLGPAAPGRHSHLRPVLDGLRHLRVIARHRFA
jgi:glycosyltransferase involved in cell wall biosynthesis